MNNFEKLEAFAEIAASGHTFEEEYPYWDASHPDNMDTAREWLATQLGFLSGSDRRELLGVWETACDDGRYITELFRSVKYLQDKYR